MKAFWVHSGLALLDIGEHGELGLTDDFLRAYLLRPELAPLDESCAAERRLHEQLLEAPRQTIGAAALAALADADAGENYRLFLRFRDRLVAAPNLQSAYLRLHKDAQSQGRIDVPPLFIDQLCQIILHNLLVDETDAIVLRAAEIWFREQQVMLDDGRVVVADSEYLAQAADPGMGDLGRLLAASGRRRAMPRCRYAHRGQCRRLVRARRGVRLRARDHPRPARGDGADALARALGRPPAGVTVKARTVAQIDDTRWRWHLGLDAQATAILNRLYNGESLSPDEHRRLLLLGRLEFADIADQRLDLAGKPVHLGLAMTEERRLRFKPQNLLFNLPLARLH
ncbi:MAG: DUF6352 family protein [Burkholderiaceae bacterium]